MRHQDIRRAHGYHSLRVDSIVQETADTRSFVLDIPDDLVDLFGYRAGQFCTFRVHIGDEELLRCYSMSSAPGDGHAVTVTVKRVADGRVSNWLHDNVEVGDRLDATPPAGVFCVEASAVGPPRPVVAFCGGSGVTPVMSIVRDTLGNTDRPISVLYANRDADSVIFGAEFTRLAAAHPDRLRVHHHLDVDAGFITPDAVIEHLDHDADHFICGPGPFMDLVESALLGAGVEPERIAIERFVNDSVESVGPSAAASSGPDGRFAPTVVTIIIDGKPTTIDHQPGDTILQTARRGALSPPFSCEAGNCATCMAMVCEGSVHMRVNNALTPDEVTEGWVLTCQAIPEGTAVTVEYESF